VGDPPDLIDRSHQFSLAALRFYKRLPKIPAAQIPGGQFYRASTAVEFNYRAAKRGRSTAEFIAKLGVVVEEIDEAVAWLEHMRDGQLAHDAALLSEAEQLRRIFGRSLGTARQNKRARDERRKDGRGTKRKI
jgi:four helix bundle protein